MVPKLLELIQQSIVGTFLSKLFSNLWATPEGQIFTILVSSYLVIYLIYGGYLSRFMGGYAVFISGLTLIDMVFLMPASFLTMVSVIIKAMKASPKHLLNLLKKGFVFVILFFVIPLLISWLIINLLASINFVFLNQYVTAIFEFSLLIIFILYIILPFRNIPSPKKIYLHLFLNITFILLLTLCFTFIFLSFLQIQKQSNSQEVYQFIYLTNASNQMGIILQATSSFLVLLCILLVLMTIFVLGIEMANITVEENILSKVKCLVITEPLLNLGLPDDTYNKSLDSVSWRENWLWKSSLPVQNEPNVYLYQPENLYMVGMSTNFVIFYKPDENTEDMNGCGVLIKREVISAMDFYIRKKEDENK